jgi:hypothetical protein
MRLYKWKINPSCSRVGIGGASNRNNVKKHKSRMRNVAISTTLGIYKEYRTQILHGVKHH